MRTESKRPLNENNYKEQIHAFTQQDWQPLIELIPKIESTSRFGKLGGGEEDKEGVFVMPYYIHSSIVSEFLEIVYDMPIIINFDWGGWNEGAEMASDESFNFDTIDLPTKCKMITGIVRSDRFDDGVLVGAFKDGVILRILKSIEKQVTDVKH
jgi:hypothetical protein